MRNKKIIGTLYTLEKDYVLWLNEYEYYNFLKKDTIVFVLGNVPKTGYKVLTIDGKIGLLSEY